VVTIVLVVLTQPLAEATVTEYVPGLLTATVLANPGVPIMPVPLTKV
jgi:hypothetical protein